MRQMVGEELALGVDRIELIEGDTALTPNQGPTAGSSGIMRGGVELRQAAATAREALLALAAERLQLPVAELTLADGEVTRCRRPQHRRRDAAGRARLRRQDEPEGAAEASFAVRARRQATAAARRSRPRSPAATSTSTTTSFPECCTAACCGRRRWARRSRRSTSRRSPALPGVRVVRIADFVGVVAGDEWAAVRAARELKVRWSASATLIGHDAVVDWARSGPVRRRRGHRRQGRRAADRRARELRPMPSARPIRGRSSRTARSVRRAPSPTFAPTAARSGRRRRRAIASWPRSRRWSSCRARSCASSTSTAPAATA